MSAIIINFQSPKCIEDLTDRFYGDGLTNIDHILQFDNTKKEWTVDRSCSIGDKVYFMCAVTSIKHMGRVLSEANAMGDKEIIHFAEERYKLYKRFAGTMVATGKISGEPFQSQDSGYGLSSEKTRWYAKIGDFELLEEPISYDDYRPVVKVSSYGAITRLSEEQMQKIEAIISASREI